MERVRQGENRGKKGRCQGGGDRRMSKRAVVMGLDHPSGLAEGPLRPDLHAGMDAQMNKWKDRWRQKSGVMIRAAGTMCWKHGDGKHACYHRQHCAIKAGSVCGGQLQGPAGPSCGQVH